jgi:hypothetical protein
MNEGFIPEYAGYRVCFISPQDNETVVIVMPGVEVKKGAVFVNPEERVVQDAEALFVLMGGKKKDFKHVVINPNDMPDKERYGDYRSAYRLNNDKIELCMAEVVSQKVDFLRQQRNTLLQQLDVQTIRFVADSGKQADVEAKKQQLRDLPVQWVEALNQLEAIDEIIDYKCSVMGV